LHRFFTQETYLGLSNTLLPAKKPKLKKPIDEARILRVLEKNPSQRMAAKEMGVPWSTFVGWIRKLKEKSNDSEGMQRGV
jgi:transposase